MKIAVVGSYGAGLTMRVPRAPVAGETLTGGVFASGHGGKGSNQAVGAARLGAEVAFLTAIGRDQFGAAARRLWADEGVDAAQVRDTDAATMVGFIIVDDQGENRIAIAPGALDELTPADVEAFAGRIAEADLVVVSLEIPLPVATAALRIAREHGTRTLLNPAPAAQLPAEAWDWIDVLTPNSSEARVLTGGDPEDDLPGGAARPAAPAVHRNDRAHPRLRGRHRRRRRRPVPGGAGPGLGRGRHHRRR